MRPKALARKKEFGRVSPSLAAAPFVVLPRDMLLAVLAPATAIGGPPPKRKPKSALQANKAEEPAPPVAACARSAAGSILFAATASNTEEGRAKIQGTVDSWARPLIEEGRFFTIGDASFENSPMKSVIPAPLCRVTGDEGRSCKVADLFIEASRRNVDWVVMVYTDMFVSPAIWESALVGRNATDPTVVAGSLGCGKTTVASGNNYCEKVQKGGGLCSSRPWAINRGGLEKLLKGGAYGLRGKARAMTGALGSVEGAGASCMILDSGVPIHRFFASNGPVPESLTATQTGLTHHAGFNSSCPEHDYVGEETPHAGWLECLGHYIASPTSPPIADVRFVDYGFAQSHNVTRACSYPRTCAAKEVCRAVQQACQA